MSSTQRRQPKVPRKAHSFTPAENSANEVLTLSEAAAYLRLQTAEVLRLVEEQGLPARRIQEEWRFLKSAIQEWLSRPAAFGPSKAAQLAVAGAWKDDPLVEKELTEILRRRGRSNEAE
jgi:excisionase family DNA binding protein